MPGISAKTTEKVAQLLERNHREHHVFFNDIGFTNHLVHHLLVAYAFGSDEVALEAIFDQHAAHQRPMPPALDPPVTHANFEDHLNNRDAYTSYLAFFTKEIDAHGVLDTIRTWVFTGSMLAHVVGGAFHPLIHIGYGVEFSLPEIVAEGLAMAACATNSLENYVPRWPGIDIKELLPLPLAQHTIEHRCAQDLAVDRDALLGVMHAIRMDAVFDFVDAEQGTQSVKLRALGANSRAMRALLSYLGPWQTEKPWMTRDNVNSRYKELYTACVLAYGASGFDNDTKAADDAPVPPAIQFFIMHGLTSSYFVHVLIPHLAIHEAAALIEAHALMLLGHYIAAGRPAIQVDRLMQYASRRTLSSSSAPITQDWATLFKDALAPIDNEHLPKTIRALALGQLLYGQETDGLGDACYKAALATLDAHGKWSF
ncbi:hypothetical protein BC940DRAFT_333423 [Gongronella butleri]|nr:hypothetical protein BC940DRAFT_333423 [Gongronella butleri]